MKVIAQRFRVVYKRSTPTGKALFQVNDEDDRQRQCFAKGCRIGKRSTVMREYQILRSLPRLRSFQYAAEPIWCGTEGGWDYLVTASLPCSVHDMYTLLQSHEADIEALQVIARALGASLFTAISYIHEHGIIHCDIRPQNVMLTWNETAQDIMVVLIDFEAASRVGEKRPALVANIGDPYYASPAFLRSPADPTPADDCLAALNVLAICAGGFRPFPWSKQSVQYLDDPSDELRLSLANAKDAEIHSYYASLPSPFRICLDALAAANFNYHRQIALFAAEPTNTRSRLLEKRALPLERS